MEFKEGTLYRAKEDFWLLTLEKPPQRKKVPKDTIVTFLKFEACWLTSDKLIKHFLFDTMILVDSRQTYYESENYFEEVILDEI